MREFSRPLPAEENGLEGVVRTMEEIMAPSGHDFVQQVADRREALALPASCRQARGSGPASKLPTGERPRALPACAKGWEVI